MRIITHEELETFRERLNEITSNSQSRLIRNTRLITLMEDLEQTYNIPVLYSAAFASRNPEVMRLYKDVSIARQF